MTTRNYIPYAPNGMKIVGTYESLRGCAELESITPAPDGTFELNYSGETDVWWDEQKTLTKNGERLFVDEDGEIWKESQITATPESAEDDDYAAE